MYKKIENKEIVSDLEFKQKTLTLLLALYVASSLITSGFVYAFFGVTKAIPFLLLLFALEAGLIAVFNCLDNKWQIRIDQMREETV